MKEIYKRTSDITKNIEKAFKWSKLQDDEITTSSVGNALKSLQRSIITIDRAIQKRPSVAIFGQSQVGKSYLVQNLAKPSDEKFLKIDAGKNKSVNFLTEMNPDGGQESTGLVTRFTTENLKPSKTHPFNIELFGQLDMAAILINSYWSDLKDYNDEFSTEKFEEIKFNLNAIKKDKVFNDIEDYDIYYFVNYVSENFKDIYLIKRLNQIGFFKGLQDILNYIPYDKRWQVLEVLWGENTFITELFKMLSENIFTMNFSRKVNVSIDALAPNNSTILDVERVRELFDNDVNHKKIDVLIEDGNTAQIDRSIFSILTKEVCLKLSNSFKESEERSFMNYSDLLDFPGSKSREKMPLSVFNNNTSKQKLQLLIRGKVSYLFDTYTNNLGVATLLYCMDDNPPEEKEAPSRLYKWVRRYVGENKDERSRKLQKTLEIIQSQDAEVNMVSPLLVVLTKFNQEINSVIPGKETDIDRHNSKWRARIQENFVNFMSRPVDDKWVLDWTNNQENFNFIFPIRDPMYSQATFEGYEIEKKETQVRPERKEALNAIGISFKGSKTTQEHILNVNEIWDELKTPNGSGIIYLAKHLKNSSNPEVTKTRLNFELDKINSELKSILKPYLVSGNINEDLKKAKLESNKSFTSIVGMANRKDNMLNQIMKRMLISDTEIWNLIYDSLFKNKDNKESESKEINIDVIESFSDLGIIIDKNSTEKTIYDKLKEIYEGLEYDEIRELVIEFINFDIDNLNSILYSDNNKGSEELVNQIIKYWVNKVISISLDDKLIESLSEKQVEAFRTLLNEILKSRERQNLKNELSATIGNVKSGTIYTEDIDLVASCCSTILNNFLFSAGWLFSEEDKKPIINGNPKPIFSNYASSNNLDNLDYRASSGNKIYFKEWSYGCKKIFEENVKYEYGIQENLNTKTNEMLDEIIKLSYQHDDLNG